LEASREIDGDGQASSTPLRHVRPAPYGLTCRRRRSTGYLRRAPLIAYTKKTIANKAEFKTRLNAIRKQGYVIDDGQVFDGVTGIAAPIKDSSGKVVGGIGVSLITAAEDKAGVKKIIKELVETTEAVSDHLRHKRLVGRVGVSEPGVRDGTAVEIVKSVRRLVGREKRFFW